MDTIRFLRTAGEDGCEGFVLWGGKIIGEDTFEFSSAIVPAQRASATRHGLLVTVSGEALFTVNRALYERGEILGAQVHSHPTDAYHSSTDDEYPLATLLGALSIVVPNFARRAPEDMEEWAWFRLSARGRWDPIDDATELEIV